METTILQHTISWWLDDDTIKELDECDTEHIEQIIKDGCSAGELNHGKDEIHGWWEIKK